MSLKNCREKKDLSITYVAKNIGVDRRTYYLWESQGKDIPSSMIIKLANLFDCSLNELLDYPVEKNICNEKDLLEIKKYAELILEKVKKI